MRTIFELIGVFEEREDSYERGTSNICGRKRGTRHLARIGPSGEVPIILLVAGTTYHWSHELKKKDLVIYEEGARLRTGVERPDNIITLDTDTTDHWSHEIKK